MSNKTHSGVNDSIKLKVLKDALLEERKKTQKLQNENQLLQEKITEKEEIISQMQTQMQRINAEMSKKDPKAYYETLLTKPIPSEELEEEIKNLKEENEKLKVENSSYEEQNITFKNNFEKLTSEMDELTTKYEEKIAKLNKEIEEKNKIISENREKEEVIQNLYRDFDTSKFQCDKAIKELKEENANLSNEKKELKNQISATHEMMEGLKNQIEQLSKDNKIIKKEMETTREITKEYLFKGLIRFKKDPDEDESSEFEEEKEEKEEVKTPRKIEIFFGKSDEAIRISIDGIENYVLIKNINSIKLVKGEEKNNLININFNEKDSIISINCEFSPRECQHIIKFYNELKKLPGNSNSFFSFGFGDLY